MRGFYGVVGTIALDNYALLESSDPLALRIKDIKVNPQNSIIVAAPYLEYRGAFVNLGLLLKLADKLECGDFVTRSGDNHSIGFASFYRG